MLHLLDMEFDPSKPYTGCRICGEVYQSSICRDSPWYGLPEHMRLAREYAAMQRRKDWSQRHSKTHTSLEHANLRESGQWCTPEAAQKLATYGIVAISDAVFSVDHAGALLEAPRVPVNDVQGTRY